MSSVLENIKRTTQQQLNGSRKWDIDAILAPRADNCIYQYLPETMNRPPMDKEQYREYFSTVIPLLTGFDFTAVHEVYDEQARKSVCHGHSTATSAIGPYRMEATLIMTFNQTGEKIIKMDEVMDSAYMADYLGKLTAHLQSQGQSE